VNGFALVLGLGAALGLLRVSRQKSGMWLDAGLLVLAGGLIGARLGYVAAHWFYFRLHGAEILALRTGGLSGEGAAAGWLVGLLLGAAIHRISPLRLADWLYPLLPPVAIAGFLASWLAGAAYGPALPPGTWWGLPAPDESGLVALRWPLLPVAGLALLVFYGLMEQLVLLPRPSGWLAALAATWYITVNLVVSLLRVDPAPVWHGLRIDTLGNLIFLALTLGLFSILTFIDRKNYKRKAYEIEHRPGPDHDRAG
jgi:phosphatidylglycerol:prolipoprotein diacylglycerol transferase